MSCSIDSETQKILDCVLRITKQSSSKGSISLKEVNNIAEKCGADIDDVIDTLISSGMMRVKK